MTSERDRRGAYFPGVPRNLVPDGPEIDADGFPTHYEVFRYRDSFWYWRLWSASRELVAQSARGHGTKEECLVSIALVKSTANDPIWDLSDVDLAKDPPFGVI